MLSTDYQKTIKNFAEVFGRLSSQVKEVSYKAAKEDIEDTGRIRPETLTAAEVCKNLVDLIEARENQMAAMFDMLSAIMEDNQCLREDVEELLNATTVKG